MIVHTEDLPTELKEEITASGTTAASADEKTETPADAAIPAEEKEDSTEEGTVMNAGQTQEAYTAETETVPEVDQPAETVVAEEASESVAAGTDTGSTAEPGEQTEEPQSRFTPDMPVGEILAEMTREEAESVRVDVGTCAGWTLAEVLDKRPVSLRWYVSGYSGENNILRAGASLLLEQSVALPKAA